VPNSLVLTSPFFNYSRPFSFIWDEIIVPVTYNTDWQRATDIMTDAVKGNAHYQQLVSSAEIQLQRARGEIAIQTVTLAPQVLVRLTDNWIELALIYPVDARQRPVMRGELNVTVLTEFAAAGITIASKTLEIVRMPQRTN
jgi:small-conductance mechanosensitive channel